MNNTPVTGDELTSEFNNGSAESFASIFNLYYLPLCYFAKRLIADHDEAEDIVVDVFIKLCDRQTNFQPIQNIKAYLYRATKNACLNYLTKSNRTQNQKSELRYLVSTLNEYELNSAAKEDIFQHIYLAIESLPVQCKRIIWMSFVEGKKNQEIADIMNLSVQTVKNQKSKGVGLLREKLLANNIYCMLLFYSYLSTKD